MAMYAIKCNETGKIYESSVQAARDLGLDNSNIRKCIKGKLKSTGGYTFVEIGEVVNIKPENGAPHKTMSMDEVKARVRQSREEKNKEVIIKKTAAERKEDLTEEDEGDEEDHFVMSDWSQLDMDTTSQYDDFKSHAYNKGNGYEAPNFPIFTEKMEGLDAGLYLFAGVSNCGKTALMQNLIWDLAKNKDNHLFGLYFTLDDTLNDLVPRLIAMNQSIPISVSSKPMRYQNMIDNGDSRGEIFKEWLRKSDAGIDELKAMNRNFKIYDGTSVTCAEDILYICECVQAQIRCWDPDANLIVAIDSLSDMTFKKRSFKSDKELNDHIAKEVKRWAVEILECPILGSLHLRKLNRDQRPLIDDVKESGRYVYEASFLGLVHNEVNVHKDKATIALRDNPQDELVPVIELDWAKNKKSSFKGRTYHRFNTNFSQVIECDKETSQRFDQLLFKNN